MADLTDFLRRSLGRPFVRGRCDCALWCADWIAECRGTDPLAAYRGVYATEAEAAAIVEAEGGFAPFFVRRFAEAGLERGPMAPGAVGIVGTLLGPALMIATADGWVGKAPRGIRFLRVPPPALVWSV